MPKKNDKFCSLKAILRQILPYKKVLNKDIQMVLYNRAWIAKIVYIFFFTISYEFSSNIIGLTSERCTEVGQGLCIGQYNEALLDKTKEYANVIMELLLFFEAIVAIACFKWRWLAQTFLYTESITHILLCFMPHAYIQATSSFFYSQDCLLHFLLYYCGQRFGLHMLVL